MNQYQQDHGNAPEQVKGRFLVFVIILILMFAYLFAGLVNLQLKSSEGYSTKTESTRLKTIPLTGKRGNITDANSVILATDEMVYNVTFYKDASESSSSVYKTYTQSIIDTLKIIERNGGKLAFSYVIQRSEETGEWEFNFGSGVSDATLQTRESQWRSNNYVTAKSYHAGGLPGNDQAPLPHGQLRRRGRGSPRGVHREARRRQRLRPLHHR